MKRFIYLAILLIFANTARAQKDLRILERRKIISTLDSQLNRSALKDTNQVVMFALKVTVVRKSSGDYKVTSINVSDSVAYKYYKSFDFLNRINYKLFTQNKKTATFIMPVALLIAYPTKTNASMESMDSLGGYLVKYLYMHDKNGEMVDNTQFIFFPLGILKTSTFDDI